LLQKLTTENDNIKHFTANGNANTVKLLSTELPFMELVNKLITGDLKNKKSH